MSFLILYWDEDWWEAGPIGVIVCSPVTEVTAMEACALPKVDNDFDGFNRNFVFATKMRHN